jgi:hypothetical protein
LVLSQPVFGRPCCGGAAKLPSRRQKLLSEQPTEVLPEFIWQRMLGVARLSVEVVRKVATAFFGIAAQKQQYPSSELSRVLYEIIEDEDTEILGGYQTPPSSRDSCLK